MLGLSGLFCCFHTICDEKILLANTEDPDQTPHYVVSDLDLHTFPLRVCT